MNHLNLDYIFPQPIWWTDLNINLKKLEEFIYEFVEKTPTVNKSNRGEFNYQSSDFSGEQSIKDNNGFSILFKEIKKYACKAFETYNTDVSKLRFSNAWINISNKGGYNEIHTHPGSIISGVYYIKIPNGNCGNIVFNRNPMETYTIHSFGSLEETSHTYVTYTYPPKENRLFLFPSWLPHHVRENKTKNDRISISFNFK